MGKKACHWLLSKLEQTVLDHNSRHFFTFREGDIVYMFQKCSNAFGDHTRRNGDAWVEGVRL